MNPSFIRIVCTIGTLGFAWGVESLRAVDAEVISYHLPEVSLGEWKPVSLEDYASTGIQDGRGNRSLSGQNEDTDILELEPMVIRPRDSVTEQFERVFQQERLHFLTRKGIAEELVPELLPEWDRLWLNRWTLPLFGISNEQRAYVLARERYLLNSYDRVSRMMGILQTSDPAYYRDNKDLQHELFRILQHSRSAF